MLIFDMLIFVLRRADEYCSGVERYPVVFITDFIIGVLPRISFHPVWLMTFFFFLWEVQPCLA